MPLKKYLQVSRVEATAAGRSGGEGGTDQKVFSCFCQDASKGKCEQKRRRIEGGRGFQVIRSETDRHHRLGVKEREREDQWSCQQWRCWRLGEGRTDVGLGLVDATSSPSSSFSNGER